MHLEVAPVIRGLHCWTPVKNGVHWWPELPPSAFVAFNLQKKDLTTIFVRYFLHVRSSVCIALIWTHYTVFYQYCTVCCSCKIVHINRGQILPLRVECAVIDNELYCLKLFTVLSSFQSFQLYSKAKQSPQFLNNQYFLKLFFSAVLSLFD